MSNTSVERIQELKEYAAGVGSPIAYVSAPTPASERFVFEDGFVALSEREARDYAAANRKTVGD